MLKFTGEFSIQETKVESAGKGVQESVKLDNQTRDKVTANISDDVEVE